MSDPVWADTPEDSDYIAAQLLDHQDRDTGWVDEPMRRPLCGCRLPVHDPHCWGPAFTAAYHAANQRSAA